MREIEPTYLTHQDEEGYPPTITRFAPGEDPSRVVFSSHRYAINDGEEDSTVEWSNDEEELGSKLDALREEHDDPDGDRFWISDAYDDPYEVEWFEEYTFGAGYKSTDAWRGYEYPTFSDELETFAQGWITGFPDETTQYKRVAEYLFAALLNEELEPPFEVFWFMGVTSNVFSQTADIIVPAGKGDELAAWLDENFSYGSEEVQHAFS